MCIPHKPAVLAGGAIISPATASLVYAAIFKHRAGTVPWNWRPLVASAIVRIAVAYSHRFRRRRLEGGVRTERRERPDASHIHADTDSGRSAHADENGVSRA